MSDDRPIRTSTSALEALREEFAPLETDGVSWKETPSQPRVREQYDCEKLADKYLDDMERGGRLHGQQKKKR